MESKQARRDFLTRMAGLSAGLAAGGALSDGASAQASDAIPKRAFGRHADMVSALGVGGHHLGNAATVNDAVNIVHEAIDGGITFFDNAWEYNNHRSEEFLGAALRGGWRSRAFVMTKVCTHGRDAQLAMVMLEESLRRLQTDHLDLWQIHAITYDNDPDLAYRKGGVIEALVKAKQQGKVKYVGFTGHKDPLLHKRMLDMGFPFDAIQFPINAFDAQFRSFQAIVLPEAVKRGIAVLGMKPFQGSGVPFHHGDVTLTPEQALHYAMSVPGVTTTITGMESLEVLRQNLAFGRGFKPLDAGGLQQIVAAVQPWAGDGRFELYKTSLMSDDIVTRQMHEMPLNGAQA